jgi:hypothetical protein
VLKVRSTRSPLKNADEIVKIPKVKRQAERPSAPAAGAVQASGSSHRSPTWTRPEAALPLTAALKRFRNLRSRRRVSHRIGLKGGKHPNDRHIWARGFGSSPPHCTRTHND